MKKNEFHNNKINELEKATGEDPCLFWKTLKSASDDLTNSNPSNFPNEGDWLSHFKKLHGSHELTKEHEQIVKTLENEEKGKDKLNELDSEITSQEVLNTAKKIKLRKAAYSDRIKNEMIKSSADILTAGFIKVFNLIMNSGKFPKSWCEGLITPIFKSDNRLDPNNYRGICVSSSLGKFFCSILNDRLMNFTKQEKIIHPSQIGFMPGSRTADHILTLKTLHDKYVKHQNNGKIYACFVDFRKAFDSIWHDGLFLKLLENKIGGRFYDIIKNLYSNTQCAVKIRDERTPFFSYQRGVCQGCVLSPILFNIYINDLPKLFEKTNSDPFLIRNNSTISNLLYADDLVILSRSKSGLQNCLNVLHSWCKKWLMEVNLKKTKVMILQKHKSKTKNMNFFIGNNAISVTHEYTYLGLKLTQNTKFTVANEQLSEKALHALYKIRKQIDFHSLTPKLACKIFDSMISPILLYNSEVWGAYTDNDFTKWDKTSTEKAHLKFCKLYLGVNRKASNIASRGELGKFPLLFQVFKKILNYIDSVCQQPDFSMVKQAFYASKELYMSGKESFYTNIAKTLKTHYPTLDEPIDLETFIKENNIATILDTLKTNYISFWKQQLDNSTKLSFYTKFKKLYKLEDYLTFIKDPTKRRLLTKFRISNHKLLIEYGRYQNIPREERKCKNCVIGRVEDEFHFAFECEKYNSIRNNILKNILLMKLTTESKQNLLTHIMSSNDPVLVIQFSNFIFKCFNVRDKCLQSEDSRS